jgi:hypothetical protein
MQVGTTQPRRWNRFHKAHRRPLRFTGRSHHSHGATDAHGEEIGHLFKRVVGTADSSLIESSAILYGIHWGTMLIDDFELTDNQERANYHKNEQCTCRGVELDTLVDCWSDLNSYYQQRTTVSITTVTRLSITTENLGVALIRLLLLIACSTMKSFHQ